MNRGVTQLRAASESDHPRIQEALASWWGDIGGPDGAAVRRSLVPRLFVQHFADTSLVALDDEGAFVGFLIGFVSQSQPGIAYIHFVGVDPSRRRGGTARAMYERFFELVAARGCTEVHCITSLGNTPSQRFHRSLGFSMSDPIPDYEGTGLTYVTFARPLGSTAAGPAETTPPTARG